MKNVYAYQVPEKYLRDYYDERKSKNPAFSIRLWATKLGLKSYSTLSSILNQNRKITLTLLPHFIKYFKFSDEESHYFETLVEYSRAVTKDEQQYFLQKIIKLTPKKNSIHNKKIVDNFSVFSNPLSFYILEAIELCDVTLNNASHLLSVIFRKKFLKYQIQNMINSLIQMGHIEIMNNSVLKRKHTFVFSKQDEINLELQQYHANLLQHSYQALKTLPLAEREFNGICMNIPATSLPSIKNYLRACIDDYVKKFESPTKSGELVAQLNFQFFIIGENTCENEY